MSRKLLAAAIFSLLSTLCAEAQTTLIYAPSDTHLLGSATQICPLVTPSYERPKYISTAHEVGSVTKLKADVGTLTVLFVDHDLDLAYMELTESKTLGIEPCVLLATKISLPEVEDLDASRDVPSRTVEIEGFGWNGSLVRQTVRSQVALSRARLPGRNAPALVMLKAQIPPGASGGFVTMIAANGYNRSTLGMVLAANSVTEVIAALPSTVILMRINEYERHAAKPQHVISSLIGSKIIATGDYILRNPLRQQLQPHDTGTGALFDQGTGQLFDHGTGNLFDHGFNVPQKSIPSTGIWNPSKPSFRWLSIGTWWTQLQPYPFAKINQLKNQAAIDGIFERDHELLMTAKAGLPKWLNSVPLNACKDATFKVSGPGKAAKYVHGKICQSAKDETAVSLTVNIDLGSVAKGTQLQTDFNLTASKAQSPVNERMVLVSATNTWSASSGAVSENLVPDGIAAFQSQDGKTLLTIDGTSLNLQAKTSAGTLSLTGPIESPGSVMTLDFFADLLKIPL